MVEVARAVGLEPPLALGGAAQPRGAAQLREGRLHLRPRHRLLAGGGDGARALSGSVTAVSRRGAEERREQRGGSLRAPASPRETFLLISAATILPAMNETIEYLRGKISRHSPGHPRPRLGAGGAGGRDRGARPPPLRRDPRVPAAHAGAGGARGAAGGRALRGGGGGGDAGALPPVRGMDAGRGGAPGARARRAGVAHASCSPTPPAACARGWSPAT